MEKEQHQQERQLKWKHCYCIWIHYQTYRPKYKPT